MSWKAKKDRLVMDLKTQQACIALWARDVCKLPESYPLIVSKVMQQYLFELMSDEDMSIEDVRRDKPHMLESIKDVCALLSLELIEMRHAKELLHEAWHNYWHVGDYLVFTKILDEAGSDELSVVVDKIIEENEKIVEAYRKGKKQAIGSLIGKAMGHFGGKADPKELKAIFEKKLQTI